VGDKELFEGDLPGW